MSGDVYLLRYEVLMFWFILCTLHWSKLYLFDFTCTFLNLWFFFPTHAKRERQKKWMCKRRFTLSYELWQHEQVSSSLCHVFDREDGCGLMGPALFCPDMVQHGIEPPSDRHQMQLFYCSCCLCLCLCLRLCPPFILMWFNPGETGGGGAID